jgi:hypothetical protein
VDVTDPQITVRGLQPDYERVQRLRQSSPLLSQDEKEFRRRLAHLIKFLERMSRKTPEQSTFSDLRRARRMRDSLNGISGPRRGGADRQVAKDWTETRDYGRSAPRRAEPRGGVRHVVSGGAPGLGKRK